MVGGGVADLPDRYQKHPALLLWDDNVQETLHREIPMNTKAILYNRWISHPMARRLNDAASRRQILKFPMLKTRQIKELLANIVGERPMTLDELLANTQPETPLMEHELTVATPEEAERALPVSPLPSTTTPRRHGDVKRFIAKNANFDQDWTVKGSISKEAARLLEVAKDQNLATTLNSLSQGLGNLIRDMGVYDETPVVVEPEPVATAKPKAPTVAKVNARSKDDFEQFETLIEDAVAAMTLIKEHLPKVRKETERLRGLRARMQSVLNVDED